MPAKVQAVMKDAARIEQRALRIDDPLRRLRYLRRAAASQSAYPVQHTWIFLLVGMALCLRSDTLLRARPDPPPAARPVAVAIPAAVRVQAPGAVADVWPVERNGDYEIYSNGLRIDNSLAVANETRSYRLFEPGSTIHPGPLRDQPAGIVFHTTESDQAPFVAGQRRALRRIGRELLLYVRHKRAYHFVIDRFGQVYRIVAETDAANHAGHSAWADARWLYLDLNSSFLGVAFEGSMESAEPVNEAQLHAGGVLTQMLRARYTIPAENCVTHAQVSLNPDNMRVGWHTDWGTGFPFARIGLPDNYTVPNPALYLLGFEYDEAYLKRTGPDVWKGLELAEARLRSTAEGRGLSPAAYRGSLRRQYRELRSALRDRGALEEN